MMNTIKKFFQPRYAKSKRQQVRVIADRFEPIRIDITGKDFIEIVPAKDISMSGVGIEIPNHLQDRMIEGDISLRITLPHPINHSFSTSGQIVHKANSFFGGIFDGIDDQDQKRLQDYINGQIRHGDIA